MSARADPTQRFADRVEAYARHRPGYPPALVEALRQRCGLRPGAAVADIGSGTGISTAILLDARATVFAVEPNAAMRAAAERLLGGRPGFQSIDGRAEATGLLDRCVDLIVAAQAFHWFDRAAARAEFVRLLRPGGRVALIWNDRRVEGDPFLRAYEAFLHAHALDYAKVDHKQVDDEAIAGFFAPRACESASFPQAQRHDLEGLRGRVLSSSYMPGAGEPGHERMLAALRALFEKHAVLNGEAPTVELVYDTRLWWGRLDA